MAYSSTRQYERPITYIDETIGPQEGPQTDFLASSADIVIYGGMAGGGKTWALLYEPLRHIIPTEYNEHGVIGFSGVVFRRTMPQIRNEGGLWDESVQMYPKFGGKPKETVLEWKFPDGQTMRFCGMQHEQDKQDWQGAQIPYIGFDELCHFTEEQFFYLLSRNRSGCGVKPYVRATCNPDVDSWVADFIEWWIEQDEDAEGYGLPIPERVGVVRYFVRKLGVVTWGDTWEELVHLLPKQILDRGIDPRTLIKSVTFIPASIYDNKKLLDVNPEYLGNLLSLSYVERERLLGGNWKIRPSSGNIFNTSWWAGKIVDALPANLTYIRYWDKAGTDEQEENANTAAHTSGVKVGRDKYGNYYIADVIDDQWTSLKREMQIQQTAVDDDYDCKIWIEQEPGSGGKESAENSIRGLAGFHVRAEKVTGDKIARAMPASAQVEAGNVYMLRAPWNKKFIEQAHAFPEGRLKDMVDAFCGAMNKLMRVKKHELNRWPRSHK